MAERTLLLINAADVSARECEILAGCSPRKDYLELKHELSADVIDLDSLNLHWWTRALRRLVGTGITQALLCVARARRYDAVFIDRETTGFVVAGLLRFSRNHPRIVVIGHYLSPLRKRVLFRVLGLGRSIDQLIVHSSTQRRIAETLGIADTQVIMLPYQTDDSFWTPQKSRHPMRQICSAGLEFRDYHTLFKAVDGLDIDVKVAAASHWSKHAHINGRDHLPSNVHIDSYDYLRLRRLYAESLFVVVPLHDVDNQAGITTILEAMAMGKAVVVTHTQGQVDVVRDRRRVSRSDPDRSTQPGWGLSLGASEEIARANTGIYVTPGDPADLRRAIDYLLKHPDQAERMGQNGRRFVCESMGLTHFTRRVAAIMKDDAQPTKGDAARAMA